MVLCYGILIWLVPGGTQLQVRTSFESGLHHSEPAWPSLSPLTFPSLFPACEMGTPQHPSHQATVRVGWKHTQRIPSSMVTAVPRTLNQALGTSHHVPLGIQSLCWVAARRHSARHSPGADGETCPQQPGYSSSHSPVLDPKFLKSHPWLGFHKDGQWTQPAN